MIQKESKSSLFLALLGYILIACQLLNALEIDPKNPVRSSAEDEIKSLPGLNNITLNFKHYSGYLEADDNKNRFWHYWFTESQSNPSKDPLVLWLNGGPGCSSLLGLLTELGPYSVTKQGLIENPFSWNKRANILFMESPAGVGFSYAVDGSVKADDDSTAKQNHHALRSFLNKFPQYRNHRLYLTGESYGGVYLPTLAVLVDDDAEMNLKGVAIGNGYLDANKLAESLVFFSYYHGLIGNTIWKGLQTHCCDGRPPARGVCKFTDSRRSQKCSEYIQDATTVILDSGLNPYNLYDRCAGVGHNTIEGSFMKKPFGREQFDKSLIMHSFNVTKLTRSRLIPEAKKFRLVRGDPPCTDDGVTIRYLNRDDVKMALNIPKNLKPFTTCFDEIQYTMIYPASRNGLAPQMRKLLKSERNLTLLVYNGDVDMMCNFLGDEWFVDDLKQKLISDYIPWHVNNQVAGFVKHYDGITYMTVKGSGHMVPTDKPAEALKMFNIFLYGHEKE